MEVKQILDAVNGPNEQGKKKTKIGLFYDLLGEDGSTEEISKLYISKPIVNVSRLPDDNNNIYYCFEFVFRSHKDEDYKQMWRFLDKYATDSLSVKEEDTKVPGLAISIIPDALGGEYFILAEIPLVDMIEKTEVAGAQLASIRLYFMENSVQFLQNDPETYNLKSLYDEVARDFENENPED